MRAFVLVKQILDWELPPGRFRIDPATRQPARGLGEELLGPFEANALEMALQLRDAGAVTEVTALSAGPSSSVAALRKALALRVDRAVLVEVESPIDPAQTAELLARTMVHVGLPDIVLAGRQAGDWDHGQVGYLVAERLGWPVVGHAWAADLRGEALHVARNTKDGTELVSAHTPVVLTATNDTSNQLRMGTVLDLMAAMNDPITRLTPNDIGLSDEELATARRLEVRDVWVPEERRECEFLVGSTAAETAALLVDRLVELKLLEL